MGKVDGFEELNVWKKSRALCKLVYEVTKGDLFAKDYSLKDQVRRAAVSISSNIAEGFERGGNKEFIQFLYIAKGSCAELRSQMYLAMDLGYISEDNFLKIKKETTDIGKMIHGFVSYLKNADIKGLKFKEESIEYNLINHSLENE